MSPHYEISQMLDASHWLDDKWRVKYQDARESLRQGPW